MLKSDEKYQDYVKILEEELIPAMGCTEPIAIAYAGAVARETLGCLPDEMDIQVSGNIIKNVKSVIVPNTGGMRGIAAALCAGVIARRRAGSSGSNRRGNTSTERRNQDVHGSGKAENHASILRACV